MYVCVCVSVRACVCVSVFQPLFLLRSCLAVPNVCEPAIGNSFDRLAVRVLPTPQPTSCCHQMYPPQPTPAHYLEIQPCLRQLRPAAVMPYSRLLLLRHTQPRLCSARRQHAPPLVMRPAGHQLCLPQVLRSRSALHAMVLAIGRANVQRKAEPVEAESPGTPTQYHQTPAGHVQGNIIGHTSAKRISRGEPRDSAYCAEKMTTGSKNANCTTLLSTEASRKPQGARAQAPSAVAQRGACDTDKQGIPPRRATSPARQSCYHLTS